MSEPCDRILVLGVQLRSDMTTLANVTCKVRKNGGVATTYTNVSSPAITQNADISYGYELNIAANTYADGDTIEATWLYSGTAYAYATEVIGPASVDGAHYTNARGDNLANLDAPVSGVAAGLWDALTSTLTTVGSIGKLLVTNIDAAITTRLADADYTAPDNAGIAAIEAATDLLGTGVVTYGGPVLSADRIELVQGDDYLTADGRALTWSSADWPSLTGSTVSLSFRQTTKPHASAAYPGSAVSATEASVELTAAQTDTFEEGTWSFALKAALASSGHEVTLAEGTAVIVEFP